MDHSVLRVAVFEYRRHIRRRAFALSALSIPLLLVAGIILLVIVVLSMRVEQRLGLVDPTGHFARVDIRKLGLFRVIPMDTFDTRAAAQSAFDARRLDGFVAIAPDYLDSGAVEIVVRRPLSEPAEGQINRLLTEGLVQTAPAPRRERLLDPARLELQTPNAAQATRSNSLALIFLPVGFALLFTLATTTTSGALLNAVADEKENRVIEILLTSVKPGQLIAGKVLGLTTLGLTQIAVWLAFIAGTTALMARGSGRPVALRLNWELLGVASVYFVLGYLLVAACYVAIGVSVASPQEGYPLVAPISIMTLAPVLLLLVILAQPNGALAVGMSLFPFTAPVTMLMRLPLVEVPLGQTLVSFGLLALSTYGVLRLAGSAARVGLLQTNRRISLRALIGRQGSRP